MFLIIIGEIEQKVCMIIKLRLENLYNNLLNKNNVTNIEKNYCCNEFIMNRKCMKRKSLDKYAIFVIYMTRFFLSFSLSFYSNYFKTVGKFLKKKEKRKLILIDYSKNSSRARKAT